jgi:peptidoglycan hydrolase-like protein with peptidoglycan-binding domain
MSTTIKTTFAGVVAAAMLFAGFAMPAKAQTVAELQAMINQLMAQIAAMQGGSQTTTSTYVHPGVTLRVGSKGTAVAALQSTLNSLGFAVGSADGNFGPNTRNGVIAFQASKGLAADGVAGNMTHNALVAATATTTTTPTTPGTPGALQGGAGSAIITETLVDVESEVREGATENVLGFRVEAQDSDIQLTNLKVTLENTDAPNSNRRPDRYISEISVMMNGVKIGSIDAADLTRDGNIYSRNITLNNAIVRQGAANRADFYITFRALSNIDSLDMDTASFDLDVNEIRFVDGTGAIMTSNTSPSVSGIEFTDLANSGDVELRVSKGPNSPTEQSIEVNKNSTTNNVTLLEFRLKAEGTDMNVEELAVTLESDGDVHAKYFGNLRLMRGSSSLAEVTSFSTSATSSLVTFDLFDDYEIEEGDTETFRVVAQLLKQEGNFTSGDRVRANLSTTTIVAEDQEGSVVPSESILGSANGDWQTLIVDGSFVTFVSSSHSTTEIGSDIEGTISLTFDVEAVGNNDIIIGEDGSGLTYTLSGAGVATTTDVSVTSSNLTSDSNGDFTVQAGDTKRFTLSAKYEKQAGFAKLTLNSVGGVSTPNVSTPNY